MAFIASAEQYQAEEALPWIQLKDLVAAVEAVACSCCELGSHLRPTSKSKTDHKTMSFRTNLYEQENDKDSHRPTRNSFVNRLRKCTITHRPLIS
jgi:hypothetical protein